MVTGPGDSRPAGPAGRRTQRTARPPLLRMLGPAVRARLCLAAAADSERHPGARTRATIAGGAARWLLITGALAGGLLLALLTVHLAAPWHPGPDRSRGPIGAGPMTLAGVPRDRVGWVSEYLSI